MIIKGKEKPTEILIGLVDKFVYNDKAVEDKMSGHPKEGRVYRILKDSIPNTEDSIYRIHIGENENKGRLDGIFLGDTLQGNHFDRWEYSITTLTPDNYLEYSIKEEDLKKVIQWFETDNEDLKTLLESDIKLINPGAASSGPDEMEGGDSEFDESELKAIAVAELEYDNQLNRLSEALNNIINNSRSRTMVLAPVLIDISEKPLSFTEGFIVNSKSDEAFISAVLSTLTISKVKDPVMLIQIIRFCLAELQRTKTINEKY